VLVGLGVRTRDGIGDGKRRREVLTQRDDRPRFGDGRIGERGKECGADGSERGGQVGVGKGLQGCGGVGKIRGLSCTGRAERANGIGVDEHGVTTTRGTARFPSR
jgi:hypothetical protein